MSAKRVVPKKSVSTKRAKKAAPGTVTTPKPAKQAKAPTRKAAKASGASAAAASKRDTVKTAKAPAKASPAARRVGEAAGKRCKAPAKKAKARLDLGHFRGKLLEKQRELLQAYTSTKDDSRDRQTDGTEDYIDYAVSSYDREFLLSLTEMEQKQLLLVEEALRKINRGSDYGRCSQCDQEIPAKRLEVQPWARYCVRCQELEEQGLLSHEEIEPEEGDEDVEVEESDYEEPFEYGDLGSGESVDEPDDDEAFA